MKVPKNKETYGLVAILDALGTAGYGPKEIETFCDAREHVLELLRDKIEDVDIDPQFFKTFTFNDTLLFAFDTQVKEITLGHIYKFFTVLRKFLVDSLVKNIFFRGSVASGIFYADDATNTLMGECVTDAASWYDKADWIGIHATPKLTITINALISQTKKKVSAYLLEYAVPMKNGKLVTSAVVNWPKVFFVSKLTPCADGENEKAKLLRLLSSRPIPLGTEGKYSNTITFFEEAEKIWKKENAVIKKAVSRVLSKSGA